MAEFRTNIKKKKRKVKILYYILYYFLLTIAFLFLAALLITFVGALSKYESLGSNDIQISILIGIYAAGLSWLFFWLARNVKAQLKIRQDIKDFDKFLSDE